MKYFFVLSFLYLGGCAAMQKDYQDRVCNYNGAFEQGANAAQKHQDMDGQGIATYCPQEERQNVMNGYRDGYTSVLNRPPPPAPLIEINTGPQRNRECRDSYGHQVCGYGCKVAYGQVRCAQDPRHDCMDSFGKIYCGLNCREEYGKVVCDEYE